MRSRPEYVSLYKVSRLTHVHMSAWLLRPWEPKIVSMWFVYYYYSRVDVFFFFFSFLYAVAVAVAVAVCSRSLYIYSLGLCSNLTRLFFIVTFFAKFSFLLLYLNLSTISPSVFTMYGTVSYRTHELFRMCLGI